MSGGGRSAPHRGAAKARAAEETAQEALIATAGTPRPTGWPVSAEQRLAAGYALGTVALRPQSGALLHVRRGPHGRSLHAAEAVQKGAYICSLRGELRVADPDDEAFEGREKLHVRAARDGEPAKFLLLGHPTAAEPGNLCNTAGGSGMNNARLARRNGSDVVRVYATRSIAAGDEVLVPYGASYTRELLGRTEEQDEAPPPRFGVPPKRVQCPQCQRRMFPKALARHVGLQNCMRAAGAGRRSSLRQSGGAIGRARTGASASG